MEIRQHNLNIDAQNGTASFVFIEQPTGGTVGLLPSVNVTVRVSGAESKTVAEVRKEASHSAKQLLQEVMRELEKSA
jgi:hypothetical protein